ncbi:MetI [Schleiferilactobacillus shenzhenensis LY-73]|uniref:MetI n=2 Tax=Schleiferilactobacillus shenzhenensis TaxID=1231337 RepID=U4TTX6_9LACO|nr:methionine ABC transporter permease [Schleiferilactobacillus shenzhenensis]ERL64892.1 MetI [Schleiferilactobacillus shenzhenensis LY-73]
MSFINKMLPNVSLIWPDVWQATLETLYMTIVSAIIAGILGLALGVWLVVTDQNGITPHPVTYNILDKLVNIFRSIPFVILLTVIYPLTKAIVGTSIGNTAALVPLVVGTIPFYARQVQTALVQVDPGVIEAAQAMGASNVDIIFRVYLREGLPDLIRVSVLTLISLIGLTAMAGAVGAGGLGNLAVSIGYQRYQSDVTIVAMLIILVMVFLVQGIGDWLTRRTTHV